jgi:predicted ATPase
MSTKEVDDLTIEHLLLHHPFRLICSGPSGAGKTTFIKHLLENVANIVDTKIDKIIYSYSEEQPLYKDIAVIIPDIVWIKGFTSDIEDYLSDTSQTKLLIVDDQMTEAAATSFLTSLFTKKSHHLNTSVIYVVQNVFLQTKNYRTISLNATCFCIFKNPRDSRQISYIAGQVCPWNPKYIIESYFDATKEPFSYLFMDLHSKTPQNLRIRGDLFEETPVIYIEKND